MTQDEIARESERLNDLYRKYKAAQGDYRMWFTAESYKLFVEWSQASIALQNKMRQHHAQTSE